MRTMQFDQSSPVHPVSESRGGGSPERDGAAAAAAVVVGVAAGLYFRFLI